MADLRVDDAVLTQAQATLGKAADRIEPATRALRGLDAAVVGADPLAEKLRDAHGVVAAGLGIIGQALADLAKYAGSASTSFSNTDNNLSHQAQRGAR